MVVYNRKYMATKKKPTVRSKRKSSKNANFWASEAGKKTFIGLLALIAFAGLVVVITQFSDKSPGVTAGVGADGFSVYEIEGADLGIANAVKKPVVVSEFGDLLKSVDDVEKSGVVSYNGNKGQTATYYFSTKSGANGSFYVDVMEYKSQQAYKEADVFAKTLSAGKIQGLDAYYMKAATIANEREYALLISKGIKSYKFAITQPFKNVKINELTAQSVLKRIAAKAELN